MKNRGERGLYLLGKGNSDDYPIRLNCLFQQALAKRKEIATFET